MIRRIFSLPNLLSAGVVVGVFLVGTRLLETNRGVVLSMVLAAVAGGTTWFVMTGATNGSNLGTVVSDLPHLGTMPPLESGPAPALEDPDVLDRYTALLREVEGRTTGRVLLVSSPGPGQGASSVALNLSIAASRAGRRVMLIDGDPTPNGLARFLSSGRSPGLSDVAAGTATLGEATRMWTLEDGSSFPMLPAGEDPTDPGALANVLVADALDVVGEHADLIVIDVPPVMWSDATPELGAHADGTILVLTDGAEPAAVATAREHLEAAGAPVVGYVRNRSGGGPLAPRLVRGAALRTLAFGALLVLSYSAYTGIQLANSWNQVEKAPLDTAAVAELDTTSEPVEDPDPEDEVVLVDEPDDVTPSVPPTTVPAEAYETMLIIGSDRVAGAADVIMYLVRPTNGADPFIVSLPRDLYIENPCTGGNSRINTLIKGCPSEDINGPTLLSYQVETITGIGVDHFAWFDFDGFVNIIDAVGGVEICVEYPVYDREAELSLPAGCTQASGEQALAWVRSRKTLQLVNGSWKSVPGASDLMRNQHQQDVIIQLFGRIKNFESPSDLTTTARSLADNFILDDGLSAAKAANLAWSLRALDIQTIRRLEIPTRLTRSDKGQSILVATASFDEVLAEAYPDSLPSDDRSRETAAESR